MKPETVSLLCKPGSHEPLKLSSVIGANGRTQEVLVGIHSGESFPIRDGIPILLNEANVLGTNQQYQRFYNRIAGVYDIAMKLFATLTGAGEGQFRREFLQELEVQDGDQVIEVSIGTGMNLRYFPGEVRYYGLDLSWGMLKKCQRNLNRWQLETELILGNAEELPLIDESFDKVFHVGGINAFNDRAKAIHEMIRVAKPKAKIMIVDETAKLMEAISWMPTAKKWLREYSERLSPPVKLVPKEMEDIQVKDIAKGNLYCLTFRKP